MSNYMKYFREAYQKMQLLEKDFDISREAMDGIQQWKDADDKIDGLSSLDTEIEQIDIIDPEADEVQDLEDTYEGKVILECVACHSKIVVDESKVYEDEETKTACPDMVCPVCNGELGYTILGKIEKYEAPEEQELEFPAEDEVEEEEEEVEEVKESLHDRIRRKHLQEAKEEEVCPECGKNPCVCEACEEKVEEACEKEESLNEGIENLSLDTEDIHMEMTADDDGKVVVTTEPINEAAIEEMPETAVEGEESVVPLENTDMEEIELNVSPEEQAEVLDQDVEVKEPVTGEEEVIEEPEEEEEFEIEEESFNYLGNTFAKKLYENVSEYKMTGHSEKDGKMVVEGLLTFNSGKQKPTTFIFENAQETRTGRLVMEGTNTTFFKDPAFRLKGKIKEGKLFCENLRYNYSINKLNESTGNEEPVVVRGIVRGK